MRMLSVLAIIFPIFSTPAFSLTPGDIAIMRRSGVLIKEEEGTRDFTEIRANISVQDFSTIYGISFRGVNMSVLPDFVFELENLRELDLSESGVTLGGLAGLPRLSNLERLDISGNRLELQTGDTPLAVLLSTMTNLRDLDLRGTDLNSRDWCGGQGTSDLSNVDLARLSLSDGALYSIIQCATNMRHMSLVYLNLRDVGFPRTSTRIPPSTGASIGYSILSLVDPLAGAVGSVGTEINVEYHVNLCEIFQTNNIRWLDISSSDSRPQGKHILYYCNFPNLDYVNISGRYWGHDGIAVEYGGVFGLPEIDTIIYDEGQRGMPAVRNLVCSHFPQEPICGS